MNLTQKTESDVRMEAQASQDLQRLLAVLPFDIQEKISSTGREEELLEVVMDLGRPPGSSTAKSSCGTRK